VTDRTALLIAGGGHLLLLALLSLGLANSLQPLARPTDVTTVDLVALSAAAPAPALAPADPGEPAPAPEAPLAAEPEPLPPEPAPAAEPPRQTPSAEPPKQVSTAEPTRQALEDRSAQDAIAEEAAERPRERPRRQTQAGAFDAGAIERLIERAAPARPAPAPGAATSGAERLDARTIASLEQAIRAQIAPCWNPPVGGADVANMTAVLRIRLNRDGSVASPPELIGQTGATPGNAAYARAFVDTARRAVLRCTPLSLPPDLYGWWRDFELNFDPRLMT
jgi:outer membrane biosynthesis protein TonB